MKTLPEYRPLPLKTKGQPWYRKTKAWLFDRRVYIITKDYYYTDQYGLTRMIPAGFCTDFASSPRFAWLIGLDPKGVLLVPAAFHDFGYRHDFYLDENGDKILRGLGRRYHDWKMMRDCEFINDMWLPGALAFSAVRAGGWLAWERNKKYHDGEIHLEGKYKELL